MGAVDFIKGIVTHPVVGFTVMLIASIILFAQCAMTLGIARKNRNAAERSKASVRSVTGLTLVVSIGLVAYAATKLACGYTPLQYSVACNLGELKNLAGNALKTAATVASAAAAARK